MNLNNQIDWSDTDRIVSNDTAYVKLDGDWWRESRTWSAQRDGSAALTLMLPVTVRFDTSAGPP